MQSCFGSRWVLPRRVADIGEHAVAGHAAEESPARAQVTGKLSVGMSTSVATKVVRCTARRRAQSMRVRPAGAPRWVHGIAADDLFVQHPDRIADRRTMRVDQQHLAIGVFVAEMAGKMALPYRRRRQGVDIGSRVAAVVVAADVDIVDVQQQAAAVARHQLAEELGLAPGAAWHEEMRLNMVSPKGRGSRGSGSGGARRPARMAPHAAIRQRRGKGYVSGICARPPPQAISHSPSAAPSA